MEGQIAATSEDNEKGVVVVRQFGLLNPLDWDADVDNELRKQTRLWNTLVEIDRYAREQYWLTINAAEAMEGIGAAIAEWEEKRETLYQERRSRYGKARRKAGVDVSDLDAQIGEIKETLKALYPVRKQRLAAAKRECKAQIDAIETERKAYVKLARQRSGLFWSNYNDICNRYNRARIRAMKDGVMLRFHAHDGSGRLSNQIQGGMSVEALMSGGHNQVSIRPAPADGPWIAQHLLTVTAYTGHDDAGRHVRRTVSFPIVMHRDFPPDSVIKEVAVQITCDALGKFGYSATFTARAPAYDEQDAGTSVAGVNLGWKSVAGGLRVATAVFGDDSIEHLLLPTHWLERMKHVTALQASMDAKRDEILPRIHEALHGLPKPSQGLVIEFVPVQWHRRLYGLSLARTYSTARLLTLLWELQLLWEEEPNAIPMLHDLATDLRAWRKEVKRQYLEMDNLRDKLLARRMDLYRNFAKRLADKAGLVVIDATSYKAAAAVRRSSDEDGTLPEQVRRNRVLASPSELRLAIEQAMAKRGGYVERYSGKINECASCGGADITGRPDEHTRVCRSCGTQFDVDENAGRNLAKAISPEDERRRARGATGAGTR